MERQTVSVGFVGFGGDDFSRQLMGDLTTAPVVGLDELICRIKANEFYMIAVGRALIANPDWLTL